VNYINIPTKPTLTTKGAPATNAPIRMKLDDLRALVKETAAKATAEVIRALKASAKPGDKFAVDPSSSEGRGATARGAFQPSSGSADAFNGVGAATGEGQLTLAERLAAHMSGKTPAQVVADRTGEVKRDVRDTVRQPGDGVVAAMKKIF
jgi:hypothetical protein